MKITLCGAYSFQKDIEHVAEVLSQMGHDVQYPRLEVAILMPNGDGVASIAEFIKENGGIDAIPVSDIVWKEKGKAIDDHVAKIVWADAVVIVNLVKNGIAGYIGGNTLMEMAVARHLRKKIFLMHRPSSQLSYTEEILGMEPTIINGDTSLII